MPSKKASLIIDHIVTRFLSPQMDYKADDFKSLSEILDLPIYALKNLDQDLAKRYREVFHLTSIRDFAGLDFEHPLNHLIPPQRDMNVNAHIARVEKIFDEAREKIGDMDKLKSTILISKMIANAWNKRNDYLSKKDTKVITIGLDNAGKTAILSSLGGRLGLDSLANLQPTKRVERKKIQTESLELYLWDFGGQADYRKMYLESPEKFFLRTDLLIYVIDMQDSERYQESFGYFKEILQIMERLGESPYILCFLHKSDPDLLNDPDFQVNIEYVQEQMKTLLIPFQFEYDMYITSIYNFFTSEPKFSRFIKDVLKDHQSLNDPMLEKVAGLGKILETTLNAVVNLASSIGVQISGLDFRLAELEKRITAMATTSPTALTPLPSPPINPATAVITGQNSTVKQIEEMAIASRRQLSELELSENKLPASLRPPGKTDQTAGEEIGDRSRINQTRSNILKELQMLIKKTKPNKL
jgi:GTPase SAR1 family protein